MTDVASIPAHEDLFTALKRSGLFLDKTFLVFFGSWKHATTGEPLLFGQKYLGCDIAMAVALFQREDFAGLLSHASAQTHLQFETRYTASGEVTSFQLIYTGPPDHGRAITEAKIFTGERGRDLLPIARQVSS